MEDEEAGESAGACRRRGRRGADARRCDRRRKDRRMHARPRPRVELRPGCCAGGRERMHRVGMRLNANESQRYRKAAVERNCCRRRRIAGGAIGRGDARRRRLAGRCACKLSANGRRRSASDAREVMSAPIAGVFRRLRAAQAKRDARCVDRACAAARDGFGRQPHSTGYDGGNRVGKCVPGAVVDWRHSTNSRHFARFFFFSRFDKP